MGRGLLANQINQMAKKRKIAAKAKLLCHDFPFESEQLKR